MHVEDVLKRFDGHCFQSHSKTSGPPAHFGMGLENDLEEKFSVPFTVKNIVRLYQKYCENNLQNSIVVGW